MKLLDQKFKKTQMSQERRSGIISSDFFKTSRIEVFDITSILRHKKKLKSRIQLCDYFFF